MSTRYSVIELYKWCFVFIFTVLKHSVVTYNLDVNNAMVFNVPTSFNSQRTSYFGFAVALYPNGEQSILLVGAPRANTSTIQNAIEPGTVYQCSINNKKCKEWIIDKTGNGWRKRNSTINQIKDHAWIGATIAIENKTNPRIVVCGPRWKNNVINKNRSNWFMNGICYSSLIKNAESFEKEADTEILPLSNIAQQTVSTNGIHVYNYGMGEVGFSMHVTSNELKYDLILGSPGIFNWKGTPILVTKPIYSTTRTVIPSIKDERRIRANDYFGYAVTSGYYIKGELWFASGAPRASHMHGNVLVFTFSSNDQTKLIVKQSLIGEQYGEYFGAALASCNLNGDDKDELIVGAPFWSKDVDEGRIYVFTTLYDELFEKRSFDGKVSGSRFGSTISCLGDIDHDGYDDIAVGAPYEDETGSIYIFNGDRNGLPKHYNQKIIGKQFGARIRGFGISISEPRDINGDKYPDIAVGAHLSEHTVLIKSKPVITVTTKLIYNENKRLLKNTTFFFCDVCTSYNGVNAPKQVRIIKSLKIDHMYGRAYIMDKSNDDTYKIFDTLYEAKDLCSQLKIHLKENIQNIIDPLEISVSVDLEETKSQVEDMNSNLFCTSCATINKLLSKTTDTIKLPFAVDCGEDNVCASDVNILLSTNLRSGNKYVVGSVSTTKLVIDAFNHGEPAYQAQICLYIPEILSLASIPPSCMEDFHINGTLEVVCDLGNPLRRNRQLILDLDMSKIRFDIDHVTLVANFKTQSEQRNLVNSTHALTIYFDADIDIAIAGKAQDDLYSYLGDDKSGNLSSIQFQHIYEVQKFGVSPVDGILLTISVPMYWKNSAEVMQIANLNNTISYMDGQQFSCIYSNSTFQTSVVKKFDRYSTNVSLDMQERFMKNINFSTNLPPENRSIYINCTNPDIMCTYIVCELGPFLSSSSVAKLSLTLDFYLSDFKSNLMDEKDIIYFSSSGHVNILEPHNITQKTGHKPDGTVVSTMFLGSPITESIATWIVVLSIVLGILLLILLILALIKIGFFKRRKKEELEALKSEANKKHDITTEASTSGEGFCQE